MQPLIAVVGPTGSGKSELAIRVAEEFDGEIVNCDSVQIYRHLDIGTAKLSLAQRRGIPHHLIDVCEPGDVFTAGDYARLARPVLHDISARGHLPIVAGGTGFYLRALIDGLAPAPHRDEALRQRLAVRAERRPASLHRILSRLDPQAATKIHWNDRQKLIRAVEVCILARYPISRVHVHQRDALVGFRTWVVGLDPPRDALYERIDCRTRNIFEAGLLDEVRGLLELGDTADSKALGSIGYAQALDCINGRLTLVEAIDSTRFATRHYAKRQWTWFRRTPGIFWVPGFGGDVQTQVLALESVRSFLEKK